MKVKHITRTKNILAVMKFKTSSRQISYQ